jgi:integrase
MKYYISFVYSVCCVFNWQLTHRLLYNIWSRFKRHSNVLEQGQTLYSFRHSGAIEIFKRTGSITKLQKAMGHSSINVSLTYLRGLEIAELKEEDMPMV